MAEKQYYWLKLEKDFFKSKEIKKLRKIAGGDTLTIIYLKMALYSLENEGILVYEGIEDDLASELSLELDEEVENIKLVLAFLQNNKMIETKGEDFYLNRIPEMTGKETGAAKRMRISRQRKEENKQLECNKVTELLQDVTTSYTEKEKDIELEKELDKEEEIGIDRLSIDYPKYIYSDSENEIPVSVEVRNKNKKDNKKENNNKNEIEEFFKDCWKLYPRKEGLASVSLSKKTELFKLGEELKRAVKRYIEKIETEKTEKKYIKQGSTFFNSGYMDYLDSNFQEIEQTVKSRIVYELDEDGHEIKF